MDEEDGRYFDSRCTIYGIANFLPVPCYVTMDGIGKFLVAQKVTREAYELERKILGLPVGKGEQVGPFFYRLEPIDLAEKYR